MSIHKCGLASWQLSPAPLLLAGAAVSGPKEGAGPLHDHIDYIFPQLRWGTHSFEQCEQLMQEKAARRALAKAGLGPSAVELFLCGDLVNQITPSGFTARALGAPYLGLFSACATAMEGLSLAALLTAAGAAEICLVAAGSHTCTAERQFRYPNEYGSQKPPYSQQTVSAAGAAVVAPPDYARRRAVARISAVTIGRVADEQICDPFQMGAAMAPAFADTLLRHLRDLQVPPQHYDLIVSGDLGRDGSAIARALLQRQGLDISRARFADCGLLLFHGADSLEITNRPPQASGPAPTDPAQIADGSVFAGGSGCGCCAAVGFGYLLRQLEKRRLKRILLCATGALLSPIANQQKESIPGICHAVALEALDAPPPLTRKGGKEQ